MKKISLFLIAALFLSKPAFSQQDAFSFLNSSEVTKYAKPLATTLGMGLNSGGFYTANIPSTFGLSISLRGMYIFIPNSQTTFTPTLPSGYSSDKSTATFWGTNGTIYSGPNGYITYPQGFNQSKVPFAVPQVTGSLFGTEVLIRYLPKITVGGNDVNFFGFGIRHSISRYIPLLPVDVAVQFLYNHVSVTNVVDGKCWAVNAEVSKTFGVLTTYGGLQYESSTFDLNYTIKGDQYSGDPSVRQYQKVTASVTGDDHARLILGVSLDIMPIVINVDYNIASQSALTGGLSFEL